MMQIKIGGHMFKGMLGVLMCAFTLHVAAQSFPNRPVKIIVPFAAGGGRTSTRGAWRPASQMLWACRWWLKTGSALQASWLPKW